jgi:RHS repeat-associated protein
VSELAGFSWSMDGNAQGTQPQSNTVWWGNTIRGKADASGLMYMRNRYYDPRTGRFTQQDPIGLAGGLNLYGFASGDPVNYADPFGLCPPKDKNYNDCDTSRPERDPEFKIRLDEAGKRAESNTWLVLSAVDLAKGLEASAELLFRFGKTTESIGKLAGEAARAEERGFPHGATCATECVLATDHHSLHVRQCQC